MEGTRYKRLGNLFCFWVCLPVSLLNLTFQGALGSLFRTPIRQEFQQHLVNVRRTKKVKLFFGGLSEAYQGKLIFISKFLLAHNEKKGNSKFHFLSQLIALVFLFFSV